MSEVESYPYPVKEGQQYITEALQKCSKSMPITDVIHLFRHMSSHDALPDGLFMTTKTTTKEIPATTNSSPIQCSASQNITHNR